MIVASADELRMAVAGQWLGGTPMRTHVARSPNSTTFSAPLVMQGIGTDTREDLSGRLFVALRGDRHDAHQYLADAAAAGAAAALVDRKAQTYTRPTSLPLIEVADTRIALADLARWWRSRLRAKVVAITGSSGKTTTRRLLDAALAVNMKGSASPKSFNNDIGVPLTVLGAAADDGYLVCEVGMSHPGEIAPLARVAAPHIAIVTMAGRAHIGGMGSAHAIVLEKASIVDGLSTNGVAVVNGDQPELVAAVNARIKPGVRVVTFGTAADCQWKLIERLVPSVQSRSHAQSMRVREPDGTEWSCELGVPGDYNAMNALAAVVAARMLGAAAADIQRALPTVAPADMRMTRQEIGGMAVFNDAYNANPDAVLASLRAFVELTGGSTPTGRRVTVLGDMLELGGPEAVAEMHAEIGRAVAAIAPSVAVFVGPGSAHGASAVRDAGTPTGVGSGTPVVLHVPKLDDAGVGAIAALFKPGDCILLKGSRGSRMEQLIAGLQARAASADGSNDACCPGTPACSTT